MPKKNATMVFVVLVCVLAAVNSPKNPQAEALRVQPHVIMLHPSSSEGLASTPAAPHVFKRGLDAPGDMVFSDGKLFVSNVFGGFGGNGSVTELNAVTGAVVRSVSGGAYRFNGPNSLALYGDNLFVANAGGDTTGSLIELNASTGKLIRVVSTPSYKLQGPGSLVPDGHELFVLDSGSYNIPGSVTELDASTGALVRVISGATYKFSTPDGMVLNRGDLFVSSSDQGKRGWLTEIDASTGKFVRIISGASYHFSGPGPIATNGAALFVLNRSESSVTEINPITGKLLRVISSLAYRGGSVTALTISGGHLYIAGGLGSTGGPGQGFVREISVSTGTLMTTISGRAYDFLDPEVILAADGCIIVLDSGSSTITDFQVPK